MGPKSTIFCHFRKPSRESIDPEIITTSKMFIAFRNFFCSLLTLNGTNCKSRLKIRHKRVEGISNALDDARIVLFGAVFIVCRNSRIIVISNLWSTTPVLNLSQRHVLKPSPFTLKIGRSELASFPSLNGMFFPNCICYGFSKFRISSITLHKLRLICHFNRK